jgi:hypothetical protein
MARRDDGARTTGVDLDLDEDERRRDAARVRLVQLAHDRR